jgi:ABC-type transport system involved in cytochrome c biogenesis permease subunit
MMARLFPWVMVVVAAGVVLPGVVAPSTPADWPQIYEFARIPVVDGGRVKPMDTIARTYLRIMSNRESWKDAGGTSRPAIEWLLNVEAEFADKEERGRKAPVFRIDHPQLQNALGLQPREGYRYSIEDFGEKLRTLAEPLQTVHRRKDEGHPLDAYETQLFEFERHLAYYQRLADFSVPNVIPPQGGKDWSTLADAAKAETPDVASWRQMLISYARNDVPAFNAAVASYLERMQQERPKDVRKAALEVRFNRLDPFNTTKWLYLVGFVLACLAWLGWSKPLNAASWRMMAFVFVVHTIALGVRMYLSGRPPVTNLYSSAIFIGWGSVLLGLILERIYKLGIGNLVASVAGFATLQIAHILAAEGDTMEVLQAVLDTQFWLATHVTCITLGYATTYVAGLLGLIYILRGVFTRSLTPDVASSLTRMIYGTVCFATFFSFIGTVLGGLWADDSWGRFWGWDPKENGALMIVLWNALLLHARWGGLAKARGIAILSVFGNVVVSWSWFGVNQLGVGLHSYGFTSGVTWSLIIFALTQFVAIGFALTPLERWKSPMKVGGASAEGGEANA